VYFYLIGINYKSAPIGAREDVYRKRKTLNQFLSGGNLNGAEAFYTCNRAEVYGVSKDLFEARVLIDALRKEFKEFADYGYIKLGEKDVFRHLLRVAAGLESQIKAEAQILGQLEVWLSKRGFPFPAYGLAHEAISSAKTIRIKSGLDRFNNNIAAVVLKDIFRRAESQGRLKVIIVGTGKIAELFTQGAHPRLCLYFAAHKNYAKAQELAGRSGGEALELKDLQQRLPAMDALISATNSPHFLFDADFFRKVAPARKPPLYLYDLAVPRDINPAVGNLKGVILNNLDTLAGVFDEYNKNSSAGIFLAEKMIEETAQRRVQEANEEDFKDGFAPQPVSVKAG